MPEVSPPPLSQTIIAQAKQFGADLAGIASVSELKASPSHRISGMMPDYNGVGTQTIDGLHRKIVQWPAGARAAIVIAIAHPPEAADLDWWVSGAGAGNTAGNRRLMAVVDKLSHWLTQEHGMHCLKLPYHVERGGIYLKDAAVLAGLGCIGMNNLLVTPEFGPRQRLRAFLVDADLPATGPVDFAPCQGCALPCRKACPERSFENEIYSSKIYGSDALPGRSGVYDRLRCNRQMESDEADFETVVLEGRETGRRVRYCRRCEFACPVGRGHNNGPQDE